MLILILMMLEDTYMLQDIRRVVKMNHMWETMVYSGPRRNKSYHHQIYYTTDQDNM